MKFFISLKNFYLDLTYSLGNRRRFLRRVAGICLVILGVHAASDLMDNAAFIIIDSIDGALDSVVVSFFNWLGSFSWISSNSTSEYARAFINLVSTEEKERASLIFALIIEIIIIYYMIRFAWGIHGESVSSLKGFQLFKKEMREGVWPLDLERISVLPSLLAFAIMGIFMAASGIETLVYDGMTIFPPWKFSGNFSAALGFIIAIVFIFKYFPILIFGALNRLEERYKKDSYGEFMSGSITRWRWLRGLFPAFVVMPTAFAGLLFNSEITVLLQRLMADIL